MNEIRAMPNAKESNIMDLRHKFLYISFFFPPLGGPEPRHNLSIIRRLYYKGFQPTIVTAPDDYPYSRDDYLAKQIPKGLDIRQVSWPSKRDMYVREARRRMRFPENPLVFKRYGPLYRVGKRAIEENNLEFVYSVHGIGAAHLAAMMLKREFDLPWVAEFRDPWIDNVIAWNYMKDNSWDWWYNRELNRTRRLMSEILVKADLIVVDTAMHRDYLIDGFHVDSDKIEPLGMGYEEEYFNVIKDVPIEFSRKPVIGFVGSVYYGYDYTVDILVKSLKILEENGFDFTLISLGDSSGIFTRCAERQNLKNFLPISRVNYSTALGLMRLLDFGIILGPKSYKLILNSKIWEYLKFNLSVLGIVPEDSMAARVIKEGNCGYILPYEQEAMYQELKRALIDYSNGAVKKANSDFIKSFSSEIMVEKLAKRIEELL